MASDLERFWRSYPKDASCCVNMLVIMEEAVQQDGPEMEEEGHGDPHSFHV